MTNPISSTPTLPSRTTASDSEENILSNKFTRLAISKPDRFISSFKREKERTQIFEISSGPRIPYTEYTRETFKALFDRALKPNASLHLPLPSNDAVSDKEVIASIWKKSEQRTQLWNKAIHGCPDRSFRAPGYSQNFYTQSLKLSGNKLAIVLFRDCFIKDISDPSSPIQIFSTSTEHADIRCIAWLSKTSLLLSENLGKTIELINLTTKKRQIFPLKPGYSLGDLEVITPLSETSFLTGFKCGSILVTDTVKNITRVCVSQLRNKWERVASIVPAQGTSGRVAVGYGNGTIAIYNSKKWDLDPEHVLWNSASTKRAVQWLPGSCSQLLVGGGLEDGCLYVYDLSKDVPLVAYKKVAQQISSITFVNKEKLEFVATFGYYETPSIKVFSYEPIIQQIFELKTLLSTSSYRGRVLDSGFSESCNRLITGITDFEDDQGMINLWDLTKTTTKTETKNATRKAFDPKIR